MTIDDIWVLFLFQIHLVIILRCSHSPQKTRLWCRCCGLRSLRYGGGSRSYVEEAGTNNFLQRSKIEIIVNCQHSCPIFLQDQRALTSPLQEENITTNTVSIYRFLWYEYLVLIFVQVRTRKIHIFTIIQLLALAFILGIKLSPLAPSFPFFIICLIPLRKLLTKFYDEHEMEEVCCFWYI